MGIRIVKPSEIELSEKEIQEAFENNLELIEEGLKKVGSFIQVGTGIIDTLAVDEENNPVIIEFKKIGDFDKDALIQLMNYYSWFISDENHRMILNNIIKKTKPTIDEVGEELRLMAVVNHVGEQVREACWALEPSIKLVTYNAFKQNDDVTIVPNLVLDTSFGGEREIKAPKTEEDHFRNRENMRVVYDKLIEKIRNEINLSLKPNPSPQYYIGLSHNKLFCTIHAKKQWLRLDLHLISDEAKDSQRYTHYPDTDWGYVKIHSLSDIDAELMNWIKSAYNKN